MQNAIMNVMIAISISVVAHIIIIIASSLSLLIANLLLSLIAIIILLISGARAEFHCSCRSNTAPARC
ncbi:MAG: hypothetical protein ACOCZA_09940 [Spirochaetota bacterium]